VRSERPILTILRGRTHHILWFGIRVTSRGRTTCSFAGEFDQCRIITNYGHSRDGVTTTRGMSAHWRTDPARSGAALRWLPESCSRRLRGRQCRSGRGAGGHPGGTPRRIGALIQYWVRRRTHFSVGSQAQRMLAGTPPRADDSIHNTG